MFYQPINFARWFKFLLVGKKGTRNVLLVVKKVKFEPCILATGNENTTLWLNRERDKRPTDKRPTRQKTDAT